MRKTALIVLGLLLIVTLASVALMPAAAAAPDTLPKLIVAAPTGLQIDTSTIAGHNLLRFTTRLLNEGAGPFEVRGTRTSSTSTSWTASQRIYQDGGYRDVRLTNTFVWAGDGHNHWHAQKLLKYTLVDPNTGKFKLGSKIGFCFFDNYQDNLSLPGAPQSAVYTTATSCAGGNLSATSILAGLSVGWGDTYYRNLAYQWVDMYDATTNTNWKPGTYKLSVELDSGIGIVDDAASVHSSCIVINITQGGSQKKPSYSVTKTGTC